MELVRFSLKKCTNRGKLFFIDEKLHSLRHLSKHYPQKTTFNNDNQRLFIVDIVCKRKVMEKMTHKVVNINN